MNDLGERVAKMMPAVDQIVEDVTTCKLGKEDPIWAMDVCLAAALRIAVRNNLEKELALGIREIDESARMMHGVKRFQDIFSPLLKKDDKDEPKNQ